MDFSYDFSDKSFATIGWITWLTIFGLSTLGGVASYVQKLRSGKTIRFSIAELCGEIFIAAFVGLIAFMVCEAVNAPLLLCGATSGVAAHLGSRGLYIVEAYLSKWIAKKLGVEEVSLKDASEAEHEAAV